MTHIFNDAFINYLLHDADKQIIFDHFKNRCFDYEQPITLKDLLESYKAIKDELRKYKQEGEKWFTSEESEEIKGWACASLFCAATEAGPIPDNCPRCGMKNPYPVTGKFIRKHKTIVQWVVNGESFTKALWKELENNQIGKTSEL